MEAPRSEASASLRAAADIQGGPWRFPVTRHLL